MRFRTWIAILGAGAATASDARGQERGYHLGQAATACVNMRAAAALENPLESRRADPSWVQFVVNDGHCIRIGKDASVSLIGPTGDLSQIEYPRGSGQRLFLSGTALQEDVQAAPIEEAKPANAWSNAGAGSGQDAACGLSGPAGPGTLAMTATADRPGVVRVILSKPSWRIPPQTPVRVSAAFPGLPVLNLSGMGQGILAEFALAENLKAWLHGFTGSTSGSLAFPGGNEAPWQLNLLGTNAAVSAMAECITASGTIAAPPPFAATSPVPVATPGLRPAPAELSRANGTADGGPVSLQIELPPIRP